MPEQQLLLQAETVIETDMKHLVQWFMDLKDHPENYAFASHQGFFFTSGDFGEVGARFYTLERFHGLPLKLSFQLSGISDTSFTFDLLKPLSHIQGAFAMHAQSPQETRLTLSVSTNSDFVRQLFKLPLLRSAIQNQIDAEVRHIKSRVENSGS